MADPVPFRTNTERVHDLRVTLSSIRTLASDAPLTRGTMKAIRIAANLALERDTARAAVSSCPPAAKEKP